MCNNKTMKIPSFHKVTELTIRLPGGPGEENDIPWEKTHLFAVISKWREKNDKFKGKTWAEKPPQIASEFVLAMAQDMVAKHGATGALRCLANATAAAFAKTGRKSFDLRLSCQNPDGTGVKIQAISRPKDSAYTQEAIIQTQTEFSAKETLNSLAKTMGKNVFPEKKFNPLEDNAVDGQTLFNLVCKAEEQLGQISAAQLMFVSALPLVAWKIAEDMGAENTEMVVSGTNWDGEDLYPGQEIFFEAKTVLAKNLDSQLDVSGKPTLRRGM